MEPSQSEIADRLRYRLILGKFQVVKIDKDQLGNIQVAIKINKDSFIIFGPPPNTDVREGDILTLYTEVLVNAKPSEPSIQ